MIERDHLLLNSQ